MISPLVSVIIATKNEEGHISDVLRSITVQTYPQIEIIIVDNFSSDNTFQIAKTYTKHVFQEGPERSSQRNYGASKSNGEYVLFLDADMKLQKAVIEECVEKIKNKASVKAVIIPEESYGVGFWARCKKLERSFYLGVDWIESARFFSKKTFFDVGGYDTALISGEDWDLSQKIKAKGSISRVSSKIMHNEGNLTLRETVSKKYYYARKIHTYLKKNPNHKNVKKQTDILARYILFVRRPKKLFQNPLLGVGVLLMKTAEFSAGALGLLQSKFF